MLGWILFGMESPLETVSPQLLDSPLHVHCEYPHGASALQEGASAGLYSP